MLISISVCLSVCLLERCWRGAGEVWGGRALGPWTRPAQGLDEPEAGRAEEQRQAEQQVDEDAPRPSGLHSTRVETPGPNTDHQRKHVPSATRWSWTKHRAGAHPQKRGCVGRITMSCPSPDPAAVYPTSRSFGRVEGVQQCPHDVQQKVDRRYTRSN